MKLSLISSSRSILTALIFSTTLSAQSFYNNGVGNSTGPFWSLGGNWSTGVAPDSSSTDVVIQAQPTSNFLVVNGGTKSVKDFTFQNTLTGSIQVIGDGSEQLNIYGNISNASGFTQSYGLIVNALGASGNWSATNAINYTNNVNVGASVLTLSGTHNFSGSSVNFIITNSSTYGQFLGAFSSSFSGTINVSFLGYTPNVNDFFDFTTGNFSGATLNIAPLSGGYSWNTTNFITNGILTVSAVPEPATYAVLLGFAALGFGAVRRRRKA